MRTLLALLLSVVTAHATITQVQNTTATTNGATSVTVTFGSNLAVGNTVILAIAAANAGLGNVTATSGAVQFSWIGLNNANNAPGWIAIGRVFSATNTVTVNNSGSVAMAVVGAEYNSTVGLLRLDKQAAASSTSTSPASGATATTNSNNELWVGCISARGTNQNTITVTTSGFTQVGSQAFTTIGTTNNDRTVQLSQNIVTATGTPNLQGTITSNTWCSVIATFEETASVSTTQHGHVGMIINWLNQHHLLHP